MKKFIICLGLLFLVIAYGLLRYSNSYPIKKATANGDFITYPEQINIERFDDFIEHINNGIDDEIRITEYSKEGKPKINDLTFYNGVITLHSSYPNNLFDKDIKTGEFTKIHFENDGYSNNMYLLNPELNSKVYICQINHY